MLKPYRSVCPVTILPIRDRLCENENIELGLLLEAICEELTI